jgi:hypothetical protein
MKNVLRVLFCCFMFAAEAFAHQVAPEARSSATSHSVDTSSAWPTLAARYAIQETGPRSARRTDPPWYFYREPDRVETANSVDATGERWERDGQGRISHARYFHQDRRIVDATFGELRTRNTVPDWDQLAALIDPRKQQNMRRIGRTTLLGHSATIYRGRTGDTVMEVTWLDQVGLAGRVIRASKQGRVDMRMTALHSVRPSAWPHLDPDATQDYLRIDVADFGDMESDPFVKRLLRTGSVSHGGGHQH